MALHRAAPELVPELVEPQTSGLAKPAPRRGGGANDAVALTEALTAQLVPGPLVERLVVMAMSASLLPRLPDRLGAALGANFHFHPVAEMLNGPLLLIGAPGAGKTTLAAKFAARFDERQVLVVSAGGAVSPEFEEDMAVLGVPLAVAQNAEALHTIVGSADGRMIIIDAAGTSLTEPVEAARLSAYAAAAGAEPVLVLAADEDVATAAALATAAAAIGARRLVAGRLDVARSVGAILAAAQAARLALVAASVASNYAFGLRSLTPEGLARRILTASAPPESWRTGPL